MAELDPKSKKLAKRIAARVAEGGEAMLGQVGPALEKLLGGRPLSERRAFAKAFLRFLERNLRERRLVVEHAGPLDASMLEELAAGFGLERGALHVETRSRPELIAGIRVIRGDNVYDSSVLGRLARISGGTR